MDIELLGLVVLGFAVGAYGTIVGFGGGFILVPALVFLYPEYEPEGLTAVSLAVVWANTTSGSLAYARQGRIDYPTGLLFALASAPGVVVGVFLVGAVPERAFTLSLAFLMLALAIISFRGPARGIRPPLSGTGVIVRSLQTAEGTYRFGYKVWHGATLSLGVGFLSSLFGIGGGWIHVPAMIVLLHFPVQFAVATSQFILVFMSGGATIIHLVNGTLAGDQLVQAAALGLGTIPGAQAGARIAAHLKGRTVLLLLAGALLMLAGRLLAKGILGI
jgi:uncharacterized membrane protein YfcA